MATLKHIGFPNRPRDFVGRRWSKITLRTLHLIGIGGVSGGVLLSVPVAQWQGFLHLTLLSGFCFLALELWSNGSMMIQLRGLIIAFKLLLLTLLYHYPEQVNIIYAVIIISSVVSHAPGNFRYFSWIHFRRMDSLCGDKSLENNTPPSRG